MFATGDSFGKAFCSAERPFFLGTCVEESPDLKELKKRYPDDATISPAITDRERFLFFITSLAKRRSGSICACGYVTALESQLSDKR
jgi:hypothetical protein